jgi:hypothetical protein
LEGYFIAKIEVFEKVKNEAIGIQFKVISDSLKSAIIIDEFADNELIMIILIHTINKESKNKSKELLMESSSIAINLTKFELDNYLVISGDTNSIHYGENPVIPALMILNNILNYLGYTPKYYTIKFYSPVYLKSKIYIKNTFKYEVNGGVDGKIIFNFKYSHL